MSGFPRALPFVLEREGGYSDHPGDRGGETNMGVTQAAYDRWRIKHGLGTRDVQDIHGDEVSSIYHEDYWVEAHCDAWWWPLNLAVFDAAVQHGPARAIKVLQESVGASVDGIVGPETTRCVAETPRTLVLHNLRWARLGYYAEIVRNDPGQSAFIVGWVNRMEELDDWLQREWVTRFYECNCQVAPGKTRCPFHDTPILKTSTEWAA